MDRIRRIRRVRGSVGFDERKAAQLLQSIAKDQDEIVRCNNAIKENKAALLAMMVDAKRSGFSYDDIEGDVIYPTGNTSRTISPKGLFERLPQKDFFECVTVSVTKAREFLPERELDKITKVTPGKRKPAELVVWRKTGKKPRGV